VAAINGGGGGSVEREERKGDTGKDEGTTWVCFYRVRRGEGASAGSNGHQWPWRRPVLMAIKGEA
jgi:hypothetical protein